MVERLTPSSYPFSVTAIRYTLLTTDLRGNKCDHGLAHQAQIYVGSGVTPPATPEPIETFEVAASGSMEGGKVFNHPLKAPLTLADGESLFVAVQNAGEFGVATTCLASCGGATTPDASYWSNAGTPPFPWTTLQSSNIDRNYSVCADGAP